MTIALVYDPRYHDFDSWAALMCEAYSAQQLQIPGPDVEWQSWAAGLKAIDIFANEAIPEPYGFEEWDQWATAVVNAVNSRPS